MSVDKEERIKFRKPSASGSESKVFWVFWILQRCEMGHFPHNLNHISGKTERIVMKILSQMYTWTRKSVKFWKSSLSRVPIRIRTSDLDQISLGKGMYSCLSRHPTVLHLGPAVSAIVQCLVCSALKLSLLCLSALLLCYCVCCFAEKKIN